MLNIILTMLLFAVFSQDYFSCKRIQQMTQVRNLPQVGKTQIFDICLSDLIQEDKSEPEDIYLIESIEIPVGNPIRRITNPKLYVQLEKNGVKIGETEVTQGWHVHFRDCKAHRFAISNNNTDKYLIKVWQDNWFWYGDELLLSIGSLNAKSFQKEIKEKGDVGVPVTAGRLVIVNFKKITDD